jgi:hypothetical protein
MIILLMFVWCSSSPLIAVALHGDLDGLDAPAAQPSNAAQLQLCGRPGAGPEPSESAAGFRPGGVSPLDAGLLAAGEDVGVEWLHHATDAAWERPSHREADSAQDSSPCSACLFVGLPASQSLSCMSPCISTEMAVCKTVC